MKDLLISKNATIKDALYQISKKGIRCLIVVDALNKMVGSLSDGDIRRSILKGNKITSKISFIYKKKPRFFFENNVSQKKIKEIFLKEKLDLIPIIDQKKKVTKIILWSDIFKNDKIKKKHNIDVIIMSGGMGKRLLPFTKVLPKALIPIKEKPVISHIIESFESQGFFKIKVIVNYKAAVLKAYLSEFRKKNKLQIINEKKPLGTAGGLNLINKQSSDHILISNCDILTNINFQDILNFHIINNNDFTLVASTKSFPIPYGVCELKKQGTLKRINEKPNFDFLVSIGVYLIKKKVLNLIKKNSYLDMNELINIIQTEKYKVGVFPIDDSSWSDIGEWHQYEQTLKSYD